MNDFTSTLHAITDCYFFKIALSALAVVTNVHFHLLIVFAALVVIDTVTKWIALSYNYNECNNLIEAIMKIPAAHRARIIDSHEMRTGFYTKMLTYLVLVLAAFCVDDAFFTLHSDAVFVKLVVTYLSITELLSITENLNEAGVSCLSNLLELIKRKGGNTR